MQLNDPQPILAAGATPPLDPPPGPPGMRPPEGGPPARFWGSRAGLAIILVMLAISTLAAPAGVAGFVYGILERPLTAGVAVALVLFAGWSRRRAILADPQTLYGRIIYCGIAGGVIGEGLTYLIFALPPGGPTSAPWVLLFALAIGGAIGLLIGLAGLFVVVGVLAGSTVPLIAKGLFRRAA